MHGESFGLTPYYEEKGITIYHADCRAVLAQLPIVDHIITDVPYSSKTHEGARTAGDGSEALIDFASTDAVALRAVFETIRVKRWVVSFMDWLHIWELQAEPPSTLEFIRMGIWYKPNGSPQFTGDRPGQGWEGVAILHPPGKKRWNGGGHHAHWTYNKENTLHPTGKPIELVSRLVRLFSDEGETILDPFMGSGTTLLAAKRLGRRAIGIEIEQRHCETAAQRLAQGELVFDSL